MFKPICFRDSAHFAVANVLHSCVMVLLKSGTIFPKLHAKAAHHVLPYTVKPALSGHSKRRPKIGFQDRLSLNAGQKYCRMLQESILQYFRPSLSYHLSLRPLFCPFLSDRLRQVLLCFHSFQISCTLCSS